LDTCVTSGVLPFALRASLWLFKIAPGDFVAGMTLSGVFAGSMEIFTHSIWGRALFSKRQIGVKAVDLYQEHPDAYFLCAYADEYGRVTSMIDFSHRIVTTANNSPTTTTIPLTRHSGMFLAGIQ
ncbi:MAG: hypothetical protein WBP02_07120, partial [Gammaproteobacteria bacterium]